MQLLFFILRFLTYVTIGNIVTIISTKTGIKTKDDNQVKRGII